MQIRSRYKIPESRQSAPSTTKRARVGRAGSIGSPSRASEEEKFMNGSNGKLSPELRSQLVPQLIETFSRLPLEKQTEWLQYRWEDIKDPKWLPLLRETRMTAVRVEPCFVSNPTEEKRLREGSLVESIAAAIVRGIERFYAASEHTAAAR